MSRRRFAWVSAACLLLAPSWATADLPGGVGVLGDSYSDEYVFYPPDRSTARNWVEILAATRGLDFGTYETSGLGEPRNAGFAYNWARSDATTHDMIAGGQLSGVLGQVASGEVGTVVVFIGGNDFIHALRSPDPAGVLEPTLVGALANHRTAVESVLTANPEVRLVLVTLPDVRNLPEFAGSIREGRLSRGVAASYAAAIGRFNAQVRGYALADRRVALIDLDLIARAADLISRDSVLVAGRRLDRVHPANDLDHFFLADVRHPGTLGQGLMARLFIDVVNARFGAGIEPLGEQELLDFAVAVSGPEHARFARSDLNR
jgi:phospholipase/lecithinase/hemolysin